MIFVPKVPRLLELKECLTLSEATRYPFVIFEEPVSPADLLRLGLDGHLRLSVRFPNYAQAKRAVSLTDEQQEVIRRWFAADAAAH